MRGPHAVRRNDRSLLLCITVAYRFVAVVVAIAVGVARRRYVPCASTDLPFRAARVRVPPADSRRGPRTHHRRHRYPGIGLWATPNQYVVPAPSDRGRTPPPPPRYTRRSAIPPRRFATAPYKESTSVCTLTAFLRDYGRRTVTTRNRTRSVYVK